MPKSDEAILDTSHTKSYDKIQTMGDF